MIEPVEDVEGSWKMWLWLPEETNSKFWGFKTNNQEVNCWIGWYDLFQDRFFSYGETILLTNANRITISMAVFLLASSLF